MGAYDYMYLVPRDQYESGRCRSGAVDGVAGNVSESSVNNIEVSNGGTVMIGKDGSSKPPAVDNAGGGGAPPSTSRQPAPRSAPSSSASSGGSNGPTGGRLAGRRVAVAGASGVRAAANDGDDGGHAAAGPGSAAPGPAAAGLPLENPTDPMDTSTPPPPPPSRRRKREPSDALRKRAINNSAKKAKEAAKVRRLEEKSALTDLVNKRLAQLRGGGNGKALPPPPAVQADIDRRIIHEMRDVHSRQRKESAARKFPGRLPDLTWRRAGRKRPADPPPSPEDGGPLVATAAKKSRNSAGRFTTVKRGASEDLPADDVAAAKRSRSRAPRPVLMAQKRAHVDEPGEWSAGGKKARRTAASVYPTKRHRRGAEHAWAEAPDPKQMRYRAPRRVLKAQKRAHVDEPGEWSAGGKKARRTAASVYPTKRHRRGAEHAWAEAPEPKIARMYGPRPSRQGRKRAALDEEEDEDEDGDNLMFDLSDNYLVPRKRFAPM